MADHKSPLLTIRTRGGDCTVIHEGVSLLDGLHNNVRKLFRKLIESSGETLDYDELERELYENEPQPPQGAYNTKNAVRSLRTALFPFERPDGKQKWQCELSSGNGPLLRLEKPHASRIRLSLPKPAGDPEICLELEAPVGRPARRGQVSAPVFTVPFGHSRCFFGREPILADLHSQLSSESCVAVSGAGGMGKSQLAAEYAHAYRDTFPGGLYWIDAKDVQSIEEEFATLSRDYDFFRTPQDLPIEERARRVRERFQQMSQPSLLILDSLCGDRRMLNLLPTTGSCRILATTRLHSVLKSRFYVIELPPLEARAAILVLQSCCTIEQTAVRLSVFEPGLRLDEARAREQAAILGICDDLNVLLPLTLTLIASYADQRKTTFEDCRRRLAGNSLKLFERAEVGYSIRDAFNLSTSNLTPKAVRVLATAACFTRRSISSELLQAAAAIEDFEQFEDAIALLERGSFLGREADGRLTVHDVLRDITFEQIDPDERDVLLARTAASLAEHVERANDQMSWGTVGAEVVQSRAVIDQCRRHRLHAPLAGLLCELGQYYRLHDETATALRYLDEATRTLQTFLPEERRLTAKCLLQVSATDPVAPSGLDYVRRALSLARKGAAADDLELAEYYNVVGYVLDSTGHQRRALLFYRRALNLCEFAASRRSVPAAEYLNNIGVLYEAMEEYDTAAKHLAESLDILTQLYGVSHRRSAIALNNLGRVRRKMGDFASALECHERALAIFQTHYGSDTKDAAMSLYFAAAALASMGRAEDSTAGVQTSLEILESRYGPADPATRRVRLTHESGEF